MSTCFFIEHKLVHYFVQLALAVTGKMERYTVFHYTLCREVIVYDGVTERRTRYSGIKCAGHCCQWILRTPVAECECARADHTHQCISKEVVKTRWAGHNGETLIRGFGGGFKIVAKAPSF